MAKDEAPCKWGKRQRASRAATVCSVVELALHYAFSQSSSKPVMAARHLDGHVQGAGDLGALERLLGAELGAAGHQARHLRLGKLDLQATKVRLGHVLDLVLRGRKQGKGKTKRWTLPQRSWRQRRRRRFKRCPDCTASTALLSRFYPILALREERGGRASGWDGITQACDAMRGDRAAQNPQHHGSNAQAKMCLQEGWATSESSEWVSAPRTPTSRPEAERSTTVMVLAAISSD